MTTSVIKFLWQYISKLKLLFFIVVSCVIIGEILSRFALYYGSQIVETLSLQIPKEDILHKAVFFAIITSSILLIKGIIMNLSLFFEARFLPKLYAIIARDLFNYAHQHSTAFFAEEMAGNVSGKIKTIIDNSSNIYYNLLWGFTSPIVAFVTSFAFILSVNVELSLILLALSLVLISVIILLSRKIEIYAEDRSKKMSEANGTLVDSITNASLVKNFSNYKHEKRIYFRSLKSAALAARKETYQFAYLFLSQGILRAFLEAIFYTVPIWYWYKGEISIGQFVLVQSIILTLSSLYNHLCFNFLHFFKLFGGIRDGLKLLSKPYDVVDVQNAKEIKVDNGAINFENVTYHYKGSGPLFEDFSLEIKAGEKIGLVGRSGSGKSTLIKILSRYYDIQSGIIQIDGQDISKVTQDSLRKNMALIPQDPSLFNRSIMENIRYGNTKATDQEVIEASKKAYCHDFIMQSPNGYDSKVGERGVMLSGGERQRIAIARAILKDAPILILDEATSALDSESEHFIHDAMHDLMKGKTVIAIAHRLSTLREMDRIIVMDKGKIVEQGTHASLLRKKGVYHSFYDLQSSGFLKLDL